MKPLLEREDNREMYRVATEKLKGLKEPIIRNTRGNCVLGFINVQSKNDPLDRELSILFDIQYNTKFLPYNVNRRLNNKKKSTYMTEIIWKKISKAKQMTSLLLLNNFYPSDIMPTSSKEKESDELLYTPQYYKESSIPVGTHLLELPVIKYQRTYSKVQSTHLVHNPSEPPTLSSFDATLHLLSRTTLIEVRLDSTLSTVDKKLLQRKNGTVAVETLIFKYNSVI
ncbi:hypothetical protein WN51_04610 [Melipona quadrifasciata]|uniref:Uncharacterized protein n=1 Tax=Melipona quadrifasciata TaxID=166423 RepID=A0A0M8ZUW0_9HYME|nr:hypothetical protein WN51_04610 [Melipona quadrifasciata]